MMEGSPGQTIGRRVRQLRDEQLLSRTDLAERAGISVPGIEHLERGVSARPRRRTVEKLAHALGVGVEELMEVDIPKAPAPLRSLPKEQRRDLLELVAAKHLRPLPGELQKLMQLKRAAGTAGMSGGTFDVWFKTYAVEDVRDELLPEEGATLEEELISSR